MKGLEKSFEGRSVREPRKRRRKKERKEKVDSGRIRFEPELCSTIEQLTWMLDTSFDSFVKTNPPIEGGFSPDPTLLLRLPRAEWRDALDKFKDDLILQKRAMAECRLYIEHSINFDNDIAKDFLVAIVDRFADLYAFSNDQLDAAESMINDYYTMRGRAKDLKEQFPNASELVHELTGLLLDFGGYFSDPVVSLGPLSIDITMDDKAAEMIFEKRGHNNSITRSTDAIASVHNFGDDTEKKQLYFSIFRSSPRAALGGDRLLKHEHEHHKHKIFSEVFKEYFGAEYKSIFGTNYNLKSLSDNYEKHKREGGSRYAVSKIEPMIQKQQIFAFNRVKDEIFAKIRNNSLDVLERKLSGFFCGQNGSSYDYPYNIREHFKERCETDVDLRELLDNYFLRDYMAVIEDSFQSLRSLVSVIAKENGESSEYYAISDATAFLADVPLQRWTKTVNRFIASINKKR